MKPEMWSDEALGTVSIQAQCLFVGLITQADDEGRVEGGAARMRALIWPYKVEVPPESVEQWLDELQNSALVSRYIIAERQYLALNGWSRNQKVDRPSMSRIPAPPNGDSAHAREDSRGLALDQGPRTKDQGDEDSLRSSSVEPRLDDPGTINELFAYWQQRCGHGHAMLTPERRSKLVARLKQGYTPEQIRQAIDGAAAAPFINPQGKKFDDIELICRTGAKLEDFAGRAANGTPANSMAFLR